MVQVSLLISARHEEKRIKKRQSKPPSGPLIYVTLSTVTRQPRNCHAKSAVSGNGKGLGREQHLPNAAAPGGSRFKGVDIVKFASSVTFGRRLAAIRVDRSLTQAELAALIGKSKATIWSWEHGLYGIRLADADKCAHVLCCRLKDLFAAVEEPLPPLPSTWSRIRRRLNQHLAKREPRPQRGGRSPVREDQRKAVTDIGLSPRTIFSESTMNERPKNSVTENIFWILLGTIRGTLDPDAVAAVVRELSAEHDPALVNAVLEAVELRLDEEREILKAVRAMPPVPPTANEQYGHA
jgi:transcriptional regulator with XRE-family HTH domain